MAVSQVHLTLEQFLALPEEEPPLEFEEGMAKQKVSPQGQHSLLEFRLADRINRVAEPPKAAMAFPELRTTFAGRSPIPDVSAYRWNRIPRTAAGRVANTFTEPPDIAIEIVSPDQSVTSLVRRCVWYVANGVLIALLVDPQDESALLFRPNSLLRALHGADVIDLGDVVPGFSIRVADLFDLLKV